MHRCWQYIAIDKPADMRIDGGRYGEKADEPNALAILRRQLPEAASEIRHCHQLDYATSGVMLYALSKKAAAEAAKLFQERRARKEYVALLSGMMGSNGQLECHEPICQDPEDDFKMMCGDRDAVWPLGGSDQSTTRKRRKHSGPAKTTVYIVGHGSYNSKPVTKVRVMPHTGRRHQIRLHCLALGHPVVGDASYAPLDPRDSRMMLHASRLTLTFGDNGHLDVIAPDPFTPDRLPGLLLSCPQDLPLYID